MCTHNDGNFIIQDYEENAKKKISKNLNEVITLSWEL